MSALHKRCGATQSAPPWLLETTRQNLRLSKGRPDPPCPNNEFELGEDKVGGRQRVEAAQI